MSNLISSGLDGADLLVFDVDGVLIDTRFSYPAVIRAAIQWCWTRMVGGIADCTAFSTEHFRISKQHPGFNDDYDIAWVLLTLAVSAAGETGEKRLSQVMPSPKKWESILETFPPSGVVAHVMERYGNPVGREELRDLCEEMYMGESFKGTARRTFLRRGLWHSEKPNLKCHWSELGLPVGIYTGRFQPELRLALARLGWQDFPEERVITPESGIAKPSGEGFTQLCKRTGTSNPVYFGDTASDRESLKRFGRGTFVAIGNLLPGEPLRYDLLSEALVDLGYIPLPFSGGNGKTGFER